jgi:hypothetical protein
MTHSSSLPDIQRGPQAKRRTRPQLGSNQNSNANTGTEVESMEPDLDLEREQMASHGDDKN